jgi:hypothetical protein
MQLDWNHLFPPGEPVIALPSWQHPRLLVSARQLAERWRDSDFYPAQSLRGQAYKQVVRLRAAARMSQVRRAEGRNWLLGEFLGGLIDSPMPPTVRIGTACAARKWLIRIPDAGGKPVAYIKWGGSESASRRIVREHGILCALPKGLGPLPTRVGPLNGGTALCLRPIMGQLVGRFIPRIRPRLANFLEGLAIHTPLSIDEHSGFAALAKNAPAPVLTWIEQLADQPWPVVIHHGDLTPWNLIDVSSDRVDWGGRLMAVDWEYASLSGAPFLDVAYFYLQIAVASKKLGPASAVEFTVTRLMRQPWPGLSLAHAEALMALAAYAAWRRALDDGDGADEPAQRWHRTIWDRPPLECTGSLRDLTIMPSMPAPPPVAMGPSTPRSGA